MPSNNLAAAGITVALAGNPNAGKTALFNKLTGGRQHVGNWPGVTVERREGTFRHGGRQVTVVDLPGVYSLGTYTPDERVARDFLISGGADVVVNVVDASNLERNLYLTTQLLELGVRLIVALNFYDVATRLYEIDVAALAALLEARVVPTVATTGTGVHVLKDAILAAAAEPAPPPRRVDYGPELEPHVSALAEGLDRAGVARARWVAARLLEGDADAAVGVTPLGVAITREAAAMAGHIKRVTREEVDVLMAERRYGFIAGLLKEAVRRRVPVFRLTPSDRIDRIVTHPWWGVVVFLVVAFAVFQAALTAGGPAVAWLQRLVAAIADLTRAGLVSRAPLLAGLIADGVVAGVGNVLVFVPNIFFLFLAIAALEDSGYIARVAFIADRWMHKIGLHGRSFIPLLLGFSCNVPAILASRTLEHRRDRLITILITPLMSCSARLPVYLLFAGAFFGRGGALAVWSLYLIGIILAAASAKLFSKLLFPGETTHFVMELPAYHVPAARGVLLHAWERSWQFVKRAGLLILAVSVIMWGLASLPPGVPFAGKESVLGRMGTVAAVALTPAGFGTWQAAVALISGFLAKEGVIGTLGVLYGVGAEGLPAALREHFTPLAAYAFLVMTLLYTPCVATVAAIKRETGSWRWTLFAVAYGLALAWLAATAVYQMGKFIGGWL